MRLSYPTRAAGAFLWRLLRTSARRAVVWPWYLALDVVRHCVMCHQPTRAALDPAELGRVGERVPLCSSCYDDDGRLMHAMAFARARWR